MADAIWKILDECLHLVFKRNELGDVIFPFITLRRMDSLLADVNERVRATNEQMKDKIDAESKEISFTLRRLLFHWNKKKRMMNWHRGCVAGLPQ